MPLKLFAMSLAQADAPEVIEAIINDEKKKIDSAANEYRKSMDILRVAKFGGILTTVITVAADVLGYCSNFLIYIKAQLSLPACGPES